MLCLIRTKACKRCGGDLSLDSDKYGTYAECIQCGAIWDESELTYPDTKTTKERQVTEALKTSRGCR